MSTLAVQNPIKLVVSTVTIICCTILLALGKIDQAAGMAPITGIVFYIIGNGVAAAQGKSVTPMIGAKDDSGPTD